MFAGDGQASASPVAASFTLAFDHPSSTTPASQSLGTPKRTRRSQSPSTLRSEFSSMSRGHGASAGNGIAGGFQKWLTVPPKSDDNGPRTAPPRLATFAEMGHTSEQPMISPSLMGHEVTSQSVPPPEPAQSTNKLPFPQPSSVEPLQPPHEHDYFSPPSASDVGNMDGNDLKPPARSFRGGSPGSAHGRSTSGTWEDQPSLSPPGNRAKRMRLDDKHDNNINIQNQFMLPPQGPPTATSPSASVAGSSLSANPPASSSATHFNPQFTTGVSVLTPGNSSVASDDVQQRVSGKPSSYLGSLSPRRLSVNSLLSGPPVESYHEGSVVDTLSHTSRAAMESLDESTMFGFDRGFPDLDIGKNDDQHAISPVTPDVFPQDVDPFANEFYGHDAYVPIEFGFGVPSKDAAFKEGGYYAKPVPVKIPNSFQPLPSSLAENQMNLLYFHHFLNHTARMLVPHDCSENPFKSILPQMAMEDTNLLNLLLAYSASHRARLLNQAEPVNRIALWVKDVFSTLHYALNDSQAKVSNANLATTIMLASLEIISPNTFEVPIPWQMHLDMARQMIVARGGPQAVHKRDKVAYFLSRWFAYLDVLGSLSGGKNDKPLFSGSYWVADELDDENDFQIDCLLGFTSRCVSILAKIAELSRQCDGERIGPSGEIRPGWQPSAETVKAAIKLRSDLEEARTHEYKGCHHRGSGAENEHGWDSLEMIATNEAFHWAGLVHLNRRILGKPSSDAEVQNAVREIVGALYKVRKGGTAEACLLFPMFTAGCDAQDPGQRDKILDRIKSVEQSGMTQVSEDAAPPRDTLVDSVQVHKARSLMQQVWETGRPWETLVTGEFVG
ncbi:MAG: hypothetical protein M1833_006387 [Piccolia ochrophora]|nr:MAG: hypothetical protein M1833_006387 [Piccolia ochrophora]